MKISNLTRHFPGTIFASILILLALAACDQSSNSKVPEGFTLVREEQVGPLDLRGYGKVSAQGTLWKIIDGQFSVVRFKCQDAKSAEILASKYLADLLGYGAVKTIETPGGIGGTTLEVRHGGTWLVGVNGSEVSVVSAPNIGILETTCRGWNAKTWQAVKAQAYPRYLDCFDNAAWGVDWSPKTKTPEQLAWMKDHPAAANIRAQYIDSQAPAPGVVDLSSYRNAAIQLKGIGKPYRSMEYMTFSGWGSWMNWFEQPGPQVQSLPPGFVPPDWLTAMGYGHHQAASSNVNSVLKAALLKTMSQMCDDPDLLGWLEPHGEIFQADVWPSMVPPDAERRYPLFLREVKKYTLRTLSESYTGDPNAFRAWDAIPYPDEAYFRGRRGVFQDLDESPWRWKAGTSLADGETSGFHQADFIDSDWAQGMRTSMRLMGTIGPGRESLYPGIHPIWFRFSRDCREFLAKIPPNEKIYLHILPWTARDKERRALAVWLNGIELGRNLTGNAEDHLNRSVELDITGKLLAGINQFAIQSNAGQICYRVFLSTVPDASFPSADGGLTRRYLDWKDYLIWEKFETVKSFVMAMRAVDPVRPIGLMAPDAIQSDGFWQFCEDYGVYPFCTGEGAFFRPMHYKGYTTLRRIPSGSEPAQPARSAKEMSRLSAYIFWQSQDCHDYVFDLEQVWSILEVKSWWTENKPLLRTMGKTDFAEHKLGLLRDARQFVRYGNNAIWNWDISRGALPALGLSPALVDGPDFEAGVAERLPVILDCATTVMDPPMLDALERYVRGGGVFVAQHHTGQHTGTRLDAWPLAARLGLTITPKWVSALNYNSWPLEKIRFTEDQSIFPSLRGKEYEGSGVSIDYLNTKRGGAIGISGHASNIRPIAFWKDGTMAITEVSLGRGKIILMGTPFMLHIKDENGKWFNGLQLNGFVAEMLASLGVKRETSASDDRIWFEHRESKNGLYDVYFACAMGIREKWELSDRIESELVVNRGEATAFVETTAEGAPDLPVEFKDGRAILGKLAFAPYQVRQFAALRADAGLTGPLHWLEVQRRFWRILKPAPPGLADTLLSRAEKIASESGEAGVDLSSGWRVRFDPVDLKDPSWISGRTDGPEWSDGAMGAWLATGHPETRAAQYRQTVRLPDGWTGTRNGRILFGLSGNPSVPKIGGSVSIWVNRKLKLENVGEKPNNSNVFLIDVTEEAAAGTLELAMQVQGGGSCLGPMGTAYLRRMPLPFESLPLNNDWIRLESWERDGAPITLAETGKEAVLGIRRHVDIPASWTGRQIRLLIDQPPNVGKGYVAGVFFNDDGSWFSSGLDITGMRVDRWLKPGQRNDIVLLPFGFERPGNKQKLQILSARLESY